MAHLMRAQTAGGNPAASNDSSPRSPREMLTFAAILIFLIVFPFIDQALGLQFASSQPLGYEVTSFVFVGLSSQNDADLKKFEEQARSWPQVRECYMLSGEVDFLLKCVAKDLSAFQSFITETLTAAKNVASVKSSLVIHPSKREPGVPVEVK